MDRRERIVYSGFEVVLDLLDHFGRHSCRDAVVRYVMGDDGPRPYDHVVPDGHSREYGDVPADPYVVAYDDRFRNAQVFPSSFG